MIRHGGWDDGQAKAVERQLVIEHLGEQSAGMWDIYERVARIYEGLDPGEEFDPGESSSDFCWLQNLLYDMESSGLIREDPEEDLYHLAGIAA